jgi:hypothetical protein
MMNLILGLVFGALVGTIQREQVEGGMFITLERWLR